MTAKTSRESDGFATLERIAESFTGGDNLFVVLASQRAEASREPLRRLEELVADNRVFVVTGTAVNSYYRPYGPFPEIVGVLARDLADRSTELLKRFGRTLRSLAPHVAGSLPGSSSPFEARLAEYFLHGSRRGLRDFYIGRNMRPRVIDDLVRFLLDAADHRSESDHRLLLCIDGLEQSDSETLEVLSNLRRYAGAQPLSIVAHWNGDKSFNRNCGSSEECDILNQLAGVGWQVFSLPEDGESDGVVAKESELRPVREGPFELASRMSISRDAGFGEVAFEALLVAWGLSAYEAARQYTEVAFCDESVADRYDKNLLLGLLFYEAHLFDRAHEHLLAALDQASSEEAQATLERLIGYNCVFGIREFDLGLDFLERARARHVTLGKTWDAAWIRNSMAFGLMQSGRIEEAIDLERTTLDAARNLPYPDRFLLSILHLNLGRLHRKSSLEESLAHIQRSMADNRGESGVYMLLLLYITLGNLYLSEGKPREAAAYFSRCVDFSFDIDLGGFSDRTFPLLARVFSEKVAPVTGDECLRGDLSRQLCHFNLALSCRAAGLTLEADKYGRWVLCEMSRWATREQLETVERVLGTDSGTAAARISAGDSAGLEPLLKPLAGSLSSRKLNPAEVAALLAGGAAVAVLATESSFAPAKVRSYVLFDPRAAQARQRLLEQFGRQQPSGGVLALSGAANFFRRADPSHPMVTQEVSLNREWRKELSAVVPIRTRLRFIDESWSELANVVGEFARLTSVPFVGALSFRRVGEEIADTPELAIKYFLETSLDALLLDDLMVEKTQGRKAAINLFSLSPQFSGFSAMPSEASRDQQAVIVARRHRLRIGASGTAVLARCDGRTTVADLVEVAAEVGGEPQQVCNFLLDLRRRGVIYFAHT